MPAPWSSATFARSHVLSAAACVLLARAAPAWDGRDHVSISNAALLLSPAAASRVPLALRSAFLEATATAETTDVTCGKHVGPAAPVDPAIEAAKTIGELRRTWAGLSEPGRIELMARAVHLAADVAAPLVMRTAQRPSSSAFLAMKDLVVFREPLPLRPPLDEAIRRRGALALWPDDGPGADSLAFRVAVNLAVEVLLLMPPSSGRSAPGVHEPVLFVVNRLPRGLQIPGPAYGPARKADLLSVRGVEIAEWTTRREEGRTVVRAVLVNSGDACATRIGFKAPWWRHDFAGRIAPAALRTFTFELPGGVPAAEVAVTAGWAPCPAGGPEPDEVGGRERLVFWATDRGPAFDNPVKLADDNASAGPPPFPLTAEILPALLDELPGGMKVGRLACDVGTTPWTCRLVVRSTREPPPASLTLRLLVSFPGPGQGRARESVTFDLRDLSLGVPREVTASHSPTRRGRAYLMEVEGASVAASAWR